MSSLRDAAAAFAPQWKIGPGAKPGYEIWFAVIHDPAERVALWLRYSRFIPKSGAGSPQALLWASLFDANGAAGHTFQSLSFPLAEAEFEPDRVRISDALIGPDFLSGELRSPLGPLRWDLRLQHDFAPYTHGPERLAGLSATHSVVISPFGRARGTVSVGDSKARKIHDARVMFTHIRGTRRVPELYWCYVPYLDDPLQAVEAVYVKPSALTPAMCFASALVDGRIVHDHALTRGLFGGNRFAYPEQTFRLNFDGQRVILRGTMNLEQKTGYIYRDTDRTPYFVVQSDVSAVECQIKGPDGATRKVGTPDFAAVEFHGAKPWPGVMYMDPYE